MKQYLKIIMAHAMLAASIDVSGVLRGFGAPGEESTGGIDVSKLNLRAGLEIVGVTGVVPISCTLDGSVISFVTPKMNAGVNRLHVELTYGTNTTAILDVDLFVPQGATGQETHELSMQAVETLGGTGGGADYKTDVYMDSAGRVMAERYEDGATVIFDEHENPILKRSADGTTELYDAFQSVRQGITPHGNMWLNIPTDGQLFVSGQMVQGNGESEATGAGSHAEGYGCKATGAASHAEGTATVASGQGSHAEGSASNERICAAIGENSHAEGLGCNSNGKDSHAEGRITDANGTWSHSEGDRTKTDGVGSHAEGQLSEAAGKYSHAEGYSAKSMADYSHAEGTSTRAEGVSSHVQGIWNKRDNIPYGFIHGCGTSYADVQNAIVLSGSLLYIKGIGGYDGTNYGQEGVLSLQEVLANMLNPEAMTLSLNDEQPERVHYSQKPVNEWTARDLAEENADRLAAFARIAEKEIANAENA